jgi:DNA polymerase III epsilon subunit-like protein
MTTSKTLQRRLVFIDAEYTGEHAYTTLVSLGLVSLDGQELYLTLNDYDNDQVTDWLQDNVLSMINPASTINSETAFKQLSKWIARVAAGGRVCLVSAGLGSDLLLLFELYKYGVPNLKYFHALHCLPDTLNHTEHFDLNTLFFAAGEDPGVDRDEFVGNSIDGTRHNALHDARLARECFLRLVKRGNLPAFRRFLNA